MEPEYADHDEYDEYGDFDKLMSDAHLMDISILEDQPHDENSELLPDLLFGLSSSPPLCPIPGSTATFKNTFYVEERHPTPEGFEQYLPPDDSKNSSQSLPSDIDYTFSDPPSFHAVPWVTDPLPAASPPEHDLEEYTIKGAEEVNRAESHEYNQEFILDDGAEELTVDRYPVYSDNPVPNYSDAVEIYEDDVEDDEVELISQPKEIQQARDDNLSVEVKEPPRVPFARPPLPPPVQPNSPVPGLTAQSPLLRCFRIGEIPNALRNREGTAPLVELFARIAYSERFPNHQSFQFLDLYHDRPPYLHAQYQGFGNCKSWDAEVERLDGQDGKGAVVRAVGRMKRISGRVGLAGLKMEVVRIWEVGWEEVDKAQMLLGAKKGAEKEEAAEDDE